MHVCTLQINAPRKIEDISHHLLGNRAFNKAFGSCQPDAFFAKCIKVDRVVADAVAANKLEVP